MYMNMCSYEYHIYIYIDIYTHICMYNIIICLSITLCIWIWASRPSIRTLANRNHEN